MQTKVRFSFSSFAALTSFQVAEMLFWLEQTMLCTIRLCSGDNSTMAFLLTCVQFTESTYSYWLKFFLVKDHLRDSVPPLDVDQALTTDKCLSMQRAWYGANCGHWAWQFISHTRLLLACVDSQESWWVRWLLVGVISAYAYRSLTKKSPVSNIRPPPIIALISCKGLKVYSKKRPPNWPRAESFQMQHDARLVYSYKENDVIQVPIQYPVTEKWSLCVNPR